MLWNAGQTPRLGTLRHPIPSINRGLGNLAFGPARQVQGVDGADYCTQSTAHTAPGVHQADTRQIGNGQRPELAALKAIAAASTQVGVHHGDEIGTGDSGRDAELGHAAEHAAAAGAAVSYVVMPVLKVPRRVYQSRILCFTQYT